MTSWNGVTDKSHWLLNWEHAESDFGHWLSLWIPSKWCWMTSVIKHLKPCHYWLARCGRRDEEVHKASWWLYRHLTCFSSCWELPSSLLASATNVTSPTSQNHSENSGVVCAGLRYYRGSDPFLFVQKIRILLSHVELRCDVSLKKPNWGILFFCVVHPAQHLLLFAEPFMSLKNCTCFTNLSVTYMRNVDFEQPLVM